MTIQTNMKQIAVLLIIWIHKTHNCDFMYCDVIIYNQSIDDMVSRSQPYSFTYGFMCSICFLNQELYHYNTFALNNEINTTKKDMEKKAPGPIEGIVFFSEKGDV